MIPKVSICIPIYNVEKYIGECLESLINQSYSNLEIILINDCTPDRSIKIAAKYANQDSRIRILEHDRNKGPMCARQTGYTAATGDYITFCDGDDKIPINGIELLMKTAMSTGADIVSGNMQRFVDNKFLTISSCELPYGSEPESVYKALLTKEYTHVLCSKLFKMKLLKNYEYTILDKATNGEDAIIFYEILQYVNNVIHIPDVVYLYRFTPMSSTNRRLRQGGIKSILYLQTLRRNIGEKYPALYEIAWVFISTVLNNLYGNGYDKEFDLNRMVKEYNLNEYIDYRKMSRHLPARLFVKLILSRMFKPNYIKYLIHF